MVMMSRYMLYGPRSMQKGTVIPAVMPVVRNRGSFQPVGSRWSELDEFFGIVFGEGRVSGFVERRECSQRVTVLAGLVAVDGSPNEGVPLS